MHVPFRAEIKSVVHSSGELRMACLSEDKAYRYWLTRQWEIADGTLLWIMLNPSTADHEKDDATICRLRKFTEREGWGGFMVVNLFAYRATDPNDLKDAISKGVNAIGPEWLEVFCAAVAECNELVVAWGGHGHLQGRSGWVDSLLLEMAGSSDFGAKCLGLTQDGQPRHPLYLRNDTPLQNYC